MGMPTVLTAAGTSTSAIWQPDWMQTPFSIQYQAVVTGSAGFLIQGTLDNLDQRDSIGTLGTAAITAGNANFFTVLAAGSSNATGIVSAPVTGLRVQILTAGSVASTVAVTFIQATFGR